MRVRSAAGGVLSGWCAAVALADPTTTIITHGLSIGSKGAWVQNMAEAVRQWGAGAGSIYRYDSATGAWRYLPSISDGSTDDVVLIFNWADESDAVAVGPNWNYADAAADALFASLSEARYLDGPGPADLLAGRAVHFLGHSRGGTVISEAARRLVLAGFPVDHVTTLDPHPVNGVFPPCLGVGDDWNDSNPARWRRDDGCAEVVFGDNYYRFDGNACDPNGMVIDSFLNVSLRDELGDTDGFDNDLFGSCPLEHTKVHTFYHGTIDLAATGDDDGCGIANAWYTNPGLGACTMRGCQGFYYSHLGGGTPDRPAMPPAISAGGANVLFNGSFDSGSYAGWSYHGGAGASAVDAAGYLRLRSGFASRTHNRFVLPATATSLVYDYRAPAASPDDELVITLTEAGTGVVHEINRLAIGAVVASFTARAVPLPGTVPLDRVYTLTAAIVGGATIEAEAHVDNIDIATLGTPGCGPCPGDLNGDGLIDTADLGLLLAAFGMTGPALPADLNGDQTVNTADLGLLIGAFGQACP